jgi:hypothetical protein
MLSTLHMLLVIAGLCHFGLLLASFSVPRVLRWDEELTRVSSLTRQLVLVHGAFIVLTIIGFGVITLAAANDLLAGTALALAVNGFIGLFWLTRLLVQAFYFDAGPWLTTLFLKVGYRLLSLLFVYFTAVYLMAAWFNLQLLWPGRG